MEHSFDIEHAQKYGIEEAIFIRHFQFWIIKNLSDNKHIHDGRCWTYNSAQAFAKIFPYMTESKIRRVLNNLVEHGIIVKGNYNKLKYDHTTWYAFNMQEAFINIGNSILQNENDHVTFSSDGNDKNVRPIPDINSYINSDNKTYKEDSIPPLFRQNIIEDTHLKDVKEHQLAKLYIIYQDLVTQLGEKEGRREFRNRCQKSADKNIRVFDTLLEFIKNPTMYDKEEKNYIGNQVYNELPDEFKQGE